MKRLIIYSNKPRDTYNLAKILGENISSPKIIGLIGELGSGKTCFTQGFGYGLGVKDYITSPTFTLLNIYNGRHKLHHLDLYRIKDFNEFSSLSLNDYIFDNEISIIEWYDKINLFIKDVDIIIIFNIINLHTRKIEFLFNNKNIKLYNLIKEVSYEFSNNKT